MLRELLFVVQLKFTEGFGLVFGWVCSLKVGGEGITPSPRRQRTMRRATTLLRRRTTSTHVWQASSCAAGEDGHRLREWASKHADDARDVLRPPPHGTRAADLSGLDQYLHSRNWAKVEAPEARALLSQALTYPLSLAAHAATLNLSAEASIAIVGARAEAALLTAV